MTSAAPAVPILQELAPQVVSFAQPKRSFTLHNARKKPVEVMFIANLITVPPVNETGPYSDVDADGDLIPGTRVVEDLYVYDPEFMDDLMILDAVKCVAHVLGITRTSDGRGAEAKSSYARSGLSLIPRRAPKSLWKAVAAEGDKRAFLASVEAAKTTVEAYRERAMKLKAANMPVDPPGRDYEYAVFTLQKYREIVKSEVESAPSPFEQESMDADLEIQAIARAKAMELAERASQGRNVDKQALFQELVNDPEVRRWANKHYKIRKRGHLPVPDSKLAEAIADSKTILEAELEDPGFEIDEGNQGGQ